MAGPAHGGHGDDCGAQPAIVISGQIYLMANPLFKEPLKTEDIKPRLLDRLGHRLG
jgi:phosphoketolase